MVVWLTPGPAVRRDAYDELTRGWRAGEPFHPSESELAESQYYTSGGTRVVIYHPRGPVAWGGTRRIAIDGPDADEIADTFAKRFEIVGRVMEPVFHRFEAWSTAICATADGAWHVDGNLASVVFRPHSGEPVAVDGIHSPVALAVGDRAVFVTSCDDPVASKLARIDLATHAVTWLCDRLARPAHLAVIGDVAHVADALGLIAIDATGAIERCVLDVPPPLLLAQTADRLYWIDTSRRFVVAWQRGRGRVIATGERLSAIDADDDRLYVLDDGLRVIAIEGNHTRTIALDPWPNGRAGILRLGPFALTTVEWPDSYYNRVELESYAIGIPLLSDAPSELVAQARTDDEARAVLADWLVERGVRDASSEMLERAFAIRIGDSDRSGRHIDDLPPLLARPLASFDRAVGYHARRAHVRVFTSHDLM